MDFPRYNFFTNAGLPSNKNRGLCEGKLLHIIINLLHRRRVQLNREGSILRVSHKLMSRAVEVVSRSDRSTLKKHCANVAKIAYYKKLVKKKEKQSDCFFYLPFSRSTIEIFTAVFLHFHRLCKWHTFCTYTCIRD